MHMTDSLNFQLEWQVALNLTAETEDALLLRQVEASLESEDKQSKLSRWINNSDCAFSMMYYTKPQVLNKTKAISLPTVHIQMVHAVV